MSPARPQYLPVAGFLTAAQLMAQDQGCMSPHARSQVAEFAPSASQSDTDGPSSQVSQSWTDDRCGATRQPTPSCEPSPGQAHNQPSAEPGAEDKHTPLSDDCEIIGEERHAPESSIKLKSETGRDEVDSVQNESVATEKIPVKKAKRKRKMYMKPLSDDLIM